MCLLSRAALHLLPIAIAGLAGCDTIADGTPVPWAPLDVEMKLSVGVSGTTLIRSEDQWQTFWRQHHRSIQDDDGRNLNATPPAVDFTRQVVVGVFYGGSPNAGCTDDADSIRRVSLEGRTLHVEVGPISDLGVCRMVVSPVQLVAVDVAPEAISRQRFTGEVPGRTDPW